MPDSSGRLTIIRYSWLWDLINLPPGRLMPNGSTLLENAESALMCDSATPLFSFLKH